jgi:hypothetical protein
VNEETLAHWVAVAPNKEDLLKYGTFSVAGIQLVWYFANRLKA